MKIPEISFSIDHYDCEGDTIETGIYLHFDHTRIRVAEDLGGYRRKASESDIKMALTENGFNVSLSMKALGYTTDGGSARQRFQKY